MAKGFGSAPDKGPKIQKSDIAKTRQKIVQKYGGNIAEGTQKRVELALSQLPPHLQIAAQLYQQLQRWDSRLASMSLLQQISEPELMGAQRARAELERLYREHDFTERHLHNLFQRITWDASADAKASRAITGDMPEHIRTKVDRACRIVAEAVGVGRCLDVGCGFGVLVPHLLQCGLKPSQIRGIDLSPEMIQNARQQQPRGAQFEVVDFMEKDFGDDDRGFEGIIFCSSLHDLADPMAAVQKAASLLRPNGKLVIAHPQGASHVLRQSEMNPVLVKRGLPTAEELHSLKLEGVKLEIEPVNPGSPEEVQEGYLAVLTKE